MYPTTSLIFVLFFAAAFTPPASAPPANPGFFHIVDLQYSGDLLSYAVEDLNNDQLQDILIFSLHYGNSSGKERWLSIFLQKTTGFDAEPDQSFQLPQDLVICDTGDIAGDSRKELVYFGAGELRYLHMQGNAFDQKPISLWQTESIFILPDHNKVRRWDFVRDFNGDGHDDLFVQDFLQARLFLRQPRGDWRENPLSISTESRVYSYYDNRFSVGHKSDALYSTPYILLDDFNLDGRADLMSVYKDSLLVFNLQPDGSFDAEHRTKIALDFGEVWNGAKIQRTHLDDKSEKRYLMRIKDVNHDGLLDIINTRLSTKESLINPETEVRIHLGRKNEAAANPGVFFPQQPDQVIQPDGSMMVLDIIDLNSDQRDDLVIPSIKIGVAQIIKMLVTRSVSIEASYYLMREDGRYPEKPDGSNTLTVKFAFKGGAASPVYEIDDFNNDGLFDVLSSSDEERLLIYWGEQGKFIQAGAGEKFSVQLPQDGTLVRAADLNGDHRADVIIGYDDDDRERKRLPRMLRILMAKPE